MLQLSTSFCGACFFAALWYNTAMETKNYRLTVCYDGTRYLGWQKLGEPGSHEYQRTIQGKLEAILTKLTGEAAEVNGSGRTDAGVHAAGQIANFKTAYPAAPAELAAYLNRYLPEDIAVIAVEEVPERFHARLHARGKVYVYRISRSPVPDVFRQRFEYRLSEQLDTEAMRRTAAALEGTHDFRCMSAAKRTKKSTRRTLWSIDIREDGDRLEIFYHGDGFLYNMVRILTGTLIEAGRGRIGPEDIPAILAGECPAGYTAPAKGLTLLRVEY